jgi:hypothetical protein
MRGSVADPDPDVWDRIRILGLINDHISTFSVCVKAIKKEPLLLNFLGTFKSIFSSKYIPEENYLRSGSGFGRF